MFVGERVASPRSGGHRPTIPESRRLRASAGRQRGFQGMSVAVITGSAGLIGSEAAEHFAGLGMQVVGIDNDMRSRFFGAEASTAWKRQDLEERLGAAYRHEGLDIRDGA